MSKFEPQPGDHITLKSGSYEVMPHPAWQEIAFGQEGRKAIVYQLKSNGRLFALKVFKPVYREPQLVDTCQALSQLNFPGMEVCARECLTRATAGSLVAQYPELEYAILMPWIEGSTWFDILFSGTQISHDESQRLARSTAKILSLLERSGFAHCDIAGGNIMVNTGTGAVSLIDVEDMFGPGLPPPGGFPQGTAGYQHQASAKARKGQWCAEGDRFSGAILLIEMLTWHHPRIRQDAHGEHYFAEGELQDPHSRRYGMAVEIVASLSPHIVGCFQKAWRAPALAAAPALAEWVRLLETVRMPALPAPEWTEEAAARYQCLTCTAHFEEPIAGGRCPRCGGKQVRQTAVVSAATRRSVSGFRCLDCAHQTERPAPGGRCPYCGTRRIVQAVIQAAPEATSSTSRYACPVCGQRFAQLAPGARCPYCATRIKAN